MIPAQLECLNSKNLLELRSTMPFRAPIAASSAGDNTLVAADGTGRKIGVIGFVLSFSGSVNAKFNSFGTADTALTGLFYGAAGVVVSSPRLPTMPRGPIYQFITNGGESLQLNLSGATAVGGYVIYDFIPPTTTN